VADTPAFTGPSPGAVTLVLGLLLGAGVGSLSGVGERSALQDRNAALSSQAAGLRDELADVRAELGNARAASLTCQDAGTAAELLSRRIAQYMAADDDQQFRRLDQQVQQQIGNTEATAVACRGTAGTSG
jgi:hypothetical protein